MILSLFLRFFGLRGGARTLLEDVDYFSLPVSDSSQSPL